MESVATRFRDTTFAVVDVETTGVDPQTDRVVEVACVLVRDGRRLDTFTTLVDPERPIPATASAEHHLTDAYVRGAPRIERVAGRLRDMTADAVLVAHNLAFDARFLPFLGDRPALCSMRFARAVIPDAPSFKNQVLRYHLGVTDPDLEGTSAHRALGDAIVTSRVFEVCVRRYLANGAVDDVPHAIATVMRPRPLAALPFGRHRGVPLANVPRGYLEWLIGTAEAASPDVMLTARAELERRNRRERPGAEQKRPRNVSGAAVVATSLPG
jgi:DNA polymerase III epsilon subunit-like protein